MAALDPAVAAIRRAVRRAVNPSSSGVLIACSGGPDSMALAAAAAFVLPRAGVHTGLITVDHQLQTGSATRASTVVEWAASIGLAPALVATVDVGRAGGPEAAARDARYAALVAAATEHGRDTVLLGHTREDQAETVLLALLRGGGARGLAGMRPVRERAGVALVRPLLDISRAQTRAACAADGLPTWSDPHNADPAYRRTHARELLAELAERLGPGVVGNLATTAQLAAADVEVLDQLAAEARVKASDADGALRVADLADQPTAVRTRVLRSWIRDLGVVGSALSHRHIAALDALVVDWHGQGPVWLPGGLAVARRADRLVSDLTRDTGRDQV